MAAASIVISGPCFLCSLPPCLSSPPLLLDRTPRRRSVSFSISSLSWTAGKPSRPGLCSSSQQPEQQAEEDGGDVMDYSSLSQDDVSYLLKLAAGSVGGASVVKYGSALFPDITRPNIVQALLAISLPVLVAILILIKESFTESRGNED